MPYKRLKIGVIAALLGIAVVVGPKSPSAQGSRGLTQGSPKKTPAVTPTPLPQGGTSGYSTRPPAQSLLQLTQIPVNRPCLVVFLPFDRECFSPNNIPLDLGSPVRYPGSNHPIICNGPYIWGGRFRQALRFGFSPFGGIQPMHLAVLVPSALADLNMNQTCTMAAWVYPELLGGPDGSTNMMIMSRGAVPENNYSVGYAFGLTPQGQPFLESRIPPASAYPGRIAAGPWTVKAKGAVPLRRWTHVCVVFEYGSIRFYFNGVPEEPPQHMPGMLKAFDAANLGITPLFVGARFASGAEIREPYFGLLDDVALWSIPLYPRYVDLGAIAATRPRDMYIKMLASDGEYQIAAYWQYLITGNLSGVASSTTPTTASTPVSPISPRSLIKSPGTQEPSAGVGSPQPTGPPTTTRTPTRIAPNQPDTGGAPRTPAGPMQGPGPSGPPRVGKPTPTPSKTQPPGVRGAPTPRSARPTPTPAPGSQDKSGDRTAPPPSRSTR